MDADQKKKLLKAFVLGAGISAVIVTAFVISANMFGLHFVMGFPLALIEAKQSAVITTVYISWFLPIVVGLFFAFFEFVSML